MHRNVTALTLSLAAAITLGIPAKAADLPKDGTIKIHSTFKSEGQPVDVGEKHLMGSGTLWGVTYNDAGSGPLDKGAWFCTYIFQTVSSPVPEAGNCAFGDAGGADKIFIVWSGASTENENHGSGSIIGGIGKYAGIQGKMAYQCTPVDAAHGIRACSQQFDYTLK
jgi:hypothetical protein